MSNLRFPGSNGGSLFDRLTRFMTRPSVEDALRQCTYPAEWPFRPQDFRRQDESCDSLFYEYPRIGVFHIDENAVMALTRYYKETLETGADILDLCSSWVSHLPEDYRKGSLTVLGMSEEELNANKVADRRVVWDLNRRPELPFGDEEFDVVLNCVSVDYLSKPLEVFREMRRVLKPGGRAIMSFSNRCFPTKVVDIWLRRNDLERVLLVGCYFWFAGGFERPLGRELVTGIMGLSDPLFVVEARKADGGG